MSPAVTPTKKPVEDDDEVWRQKRQQRKEEKSDAIERARLRREDEEKKIEQDRKAAAAEKLRQLDERTGKKKDDSDKEGESDTKSEGRSSRTPSESSEKDSRERSYSREQHKFSPGEGTNKTSSRTVPPRFQRQQSDQQMPPRSQPQQQQPGSPQPHPAQMRPGQPPPPWGFWPPMPFMGYGPRPPMDMSNMPMYPPVRRRNDSHGSGTESQDNDGKHDYERDPRAWQNYPVPPHPGQFDGRPPFFDGRSMYPDYDRGFLEYDRRIMATNWSVCGVCDYRHITKPSVVWCSECDEGLCEECKDHHRISKASRNHDTVSITEYRKLPNDVLQLARSCDKHNEKYVLFCKKHDCPCCKKCVVESHMECKELTDIDDITRNIKSSNMLAEIEQTLSEIAENIKRLRLDREDNLASLGKKSREIEKEILETRARINLYLDKLQDAILKDLKTKEEEENYKIRRLMKSMTDKEKEIAELQTNIGNMKQYASELQTFLALKHIEKDVVAEEKYIQSMVKSDDANQVDFSCKINPSLQGLISAIQKFGDVVVTTDPCNIPILKQKDKQAQIMVAVTPMTIDSLKPTLLQTLDTKLPFVSGCTFMPDGRMIFSCYSQNRIIFLRPDGCMDFDIGNVCSVFDVTYIGDNTVAVTSGYDTDYVHIRVIDLQTRKVKKTLNSNSINTGVAYCKDKLIYCAKQDGIQIINLNDESIVNVTKTSVTLYSYVTTFRDKIFYTDCNAASVTCIDFQGNIQWVFKKSVLKDPFGISVDGCGNIYVVGGGSNNVVVISPNGQHYRELLTIEHGLDEPMVIHIDRSSNKMLVSNTEGKAFVYNLK
ncbi:Hypothetical predicted protein [Mytilus galloprovincialis]|nr:Hypothetical predicted protein [Mytilus galloprovincialis]